MFLLEVLVDLKLDETCDSKCQYKTKDYTHDDFFIFLYNFHIFLSSFKRS